MLVAITTWLFDPQGPVVVNDLSMPPEAGSGWLQPIALGLLLVSIVTTMIQRRRMRKLGVDGVVGLRTFALGAAVGNALLDLGSVLTPDRPAAESIRDLEEGVVVDDLGDGRPPGEGPRPPAHPGG